LRFDHPPFLPAVFSCDFFLSLPPVSHPSGWPIFFHHVDRSLGEEFGLSTGCIGVFLFCPTLWNWPDQVLPRFVFLFYYLAIKAFWFFSDFLPAQEGPFFSRWISWYFSVISPVLFLLRLCNTPCSRGLRITSFAWQVRFFFFFSFLFFFSLPDFLLQLRGLLFFPGVVGPPVTSRRFFLIPSRLLFFVFWRSAPLFPPVPLPVHALLSLWAPILPSCPPRWPLFNRPFPWFLLPLFTGLHPTSLPSFFFPGDILIF